MRNLGIVIKHEIVSTLTKPAFWITTFVLPALVMGLSFGSQLLSMQIFEQDEEIFTEPEPGEQVPVVIGYVDYAGIVTHLPSGIPPTLMRAFSDKSAAQAALEAGELREYYVISADYVESGVLHVVQAEFNPLGNLATMDLFEYVVNANLLGDEQLANLASNPISTLNVTALEKETSSGEDFSTRFVVQYGVLFIFFFVLTMSSSYMLRSVSREKENRTVEVLLVSLRPRELMLGKVLGLGVVALLQMAIWLGGSTFTLQNGGELLPALGMMVDQVSFPQGFFIWTGLYFLLGYLLYSSLLGAIGALAPTARETGSFTFLAMLPLMLPLWLNTVFIQAPNSTLATIISLFPLTAPTSMLPRLAAGGVPFWQPMVGVVLLAGATYLLVLLSARFFRADTLLSSASLNWGRVVEEFKKS